MGLGYKLGQISYEFYYVAIVLILLCQKDDKTFSLCGAKASIMIHSVSIVTQNELCAWLMMNLLINC